MSKKNTKNQIKNLTQLTITLPNEIIEIVEKYAKENYLSRSGAIRQLVIDTIKNNKLLKK